MSEIGKRIKYIRKSGEMSQEVFAKTLGVHHSHISKIETGAAVPSKQLIKSICRGWDIREEWLREGKEPISESPDLKPETIQELYQDLDRISYDSFKRYLEMTIGLLESMIKNFSHFSKNKNIQGWESVTVEQKDMILKLQKELSGKLIWLLNWLLSQLLSRK